MTDESSQAPTRWMGPFGNGIYPDTGLLKKWPEEGPEILWTFDGLGIGYSSAVIQNGFLFATGMIDSTGYLFKLNSYGELIYKVPYGIEWTGSYQGTRGSPTVVGDKLYVVSGRGKLVCFNNEDGNIIWSCKGEGDLSAYCTPLLFKHNGRKMLATYTASHLLGLDTASGNLLWSVDVPTEWSVHSHTPLYSEGEIFYPTGWEIGGGKVKLSEDGMSASEVWENIVCDYYYTALLLDGYLYASYSDNKDLTWRCVDWSTDDS